MISRHGHIRQLVEQISPQLREHPAHVQKIYSTSRYLSFQMRLPGKSFYLHVGRGGGNEGLWLGDTSPPSPLRLRDTWLEWCRKNLTSVLWQNITVDSCDRAVRLDFRRAGEKLSWFIFWAGRLTYFAFQRPDGWFLSWRDGDPEADGFSVFDEVGRRQTAVVEEAAKSPVSIDILWKGEQEQLEKQQRPSKSKLKSQELKVKRIEEDLVKIRQWQDGQEHLHSINPEEFGAEFRFLSLKYKFPGGLGPWQKKEWLYGQLKRLKAAEAHQAKRLLEAQQQLERLNEKPVVEESSLKPFRPVWKTMQAKSTPSKDQQDDFVIHSLEGYRIALGTSARGNDQLRKTWAKADDWWVHAAHGTSAHAVIKLATPGIPTPAQINQAARLIAKQSGIAAQQLEVIMTMIKNVRGVTGTPGLVTYKKTKTLLCDLEN